jgi:hypothetical protein
MKINQESIQSHPKSGKFTQHFLPSPATEVPRRCRCLVAVALEGAKEQLPKDHGQRGGQGEAEEQPRLGIRWEPSHDGLYS